MVPADHVCFLLTQKVIVVDGEFQFRNADALCDMKETIGQDKDLRRAAGEKHRVFDKSPAANRPACTRQKSLRLTRLGEELYGSVSSMRGMVFQTDQWKTARPSVFKARTFFFNLKIRAALLSLCLLPVLCSAETQQPRIASVVAAAANHDHPVDATYRHLESGIRTFNLTEKEGQHAHHYAHARAGESGPAGHASHR